jgi:DNA-binding beta-propeller fold protein YncE
MPPAHRIARVWSLDDLAHPLSLPVAVAVDRHGDLYVVDAGHNRLQKFDQDGRFLTMWGGEGDGPGQFRFRRPDRCDDREQEFCEPDVGGGVAVDGEDNVYVADYGNARVQVFDRDGRLRRRWGSEGSGPGEFLLPRGVSVDGQGRVAVADQANQRVQQFDRSGRFLAAWGGAVLGDGEPWRPVAVTMDEHGRLHVVDAGRGLAQQFDRDGRRLARWRWEANGRGEAGLTEHAAGVAVDRAGNLYVTSGGRLLKFAPDGSPLASWGGGGPGQGQFRFPTGIALDAEGSLYVVDQADNQVHKFRQLVAGAPAVRAP